MSFTRQKLLLLQNYLASQLIMLQISSQNYLAKFVFHDEIRNYLVPQYLLRHRLHHLVACSVSFLKLQKKLMVTREYQIISDESPNTLPLLYDDFFILMVLRSSAILLIIFMYFHCRGSSSVFCYVVQYQPAVCGGGYAHSSVV